MRRKKLISILILTVPGAASLWLGISCVCTLCKAVSQPYLLSDTARYDFLGYYITAISFGAACLCGIVAVAVTIKIKHRKKAAAKEKIKAAVG